MERTGDPRPFILSPPRVGLGAVSPFNPTAPTAPTVALVDNAGAGGTGSGGGEGPVVGAARLHALLYAPEPSLAPPEEGIHNTSLPGFVALYGDILPRADPEVRRPLSSPLFSPI